MKEIIVEMEQIYILTRGRPFMNVDIKSDPEDEDLQSGLAKFSQLRGFCSYGKGLDWRRE